MKYIQIRDARTSIYRIRRYEKLKTNLKNYTWFVLFSMRNEIKLLFLDDETSIRDITTTFIRSQIQNAIFDRIWCAVCRNAFHDQANIVTYFQRSLLSTIDACSCNNNEALAAVTTAHHDEPSWTAMKIIEPRGNQTRGRFFPYGDGDHARGPD